MKKTLTLLAFLLTICFSINAQKRTPLPECKFIVVVEKAYFYNLDNSSGTEKYTQRKGYLALGDVVWVVCKYSDGEYVYVEFKNKKGQITKGYIKSTELKEVEP
jgi:hypothetical protein